MGQAGPLRGDPKTVFCTVEIPELGEEGEEGLHGLIFSGVPQPLQALRHHHFMPEDYVFLLCPEISLWGLLGL